MYEILKKYVIYNIFLKIEEVSFDSSLKSHLFSSETDVQLNLV